MELVNRNKKIFLISGKARHGKDTTAEIIGQLVNEKGLKSINLSFGSYIKEYTKKISNWDGNEETKESVRGLLQQLGTEIIRAKIDNYFFINRIIQDIMVYSYYFDIITISDIRLLEEIEKLTERFDNSVTIHVFRPNLETNLTATEQKHRTETSLDNFHDYDYELINDGTIEDLKEKIAVIVDKELM